MFIKYDKLDDYIKKLDMLPKGSDVYLSVVKDISETGIVTPSIVIQVLDGDKCYTHFYTDLTPFQVIPNATLGSMPDAENVKKKYKDLHESFEQKIETEYKKFISLLKDNLKFLNIVERATIMQ